MKFTVTFIFLMIFGSTFAQTKITTTVGSKSTLKMRRYTQFIGANENYVYTFNHYYTFSDFVDEIEKIDKKTMEVSASLNLNDVTDIGEAEAMLVGENIIIVNETGLLEGRFREVSYFILNANTLEVNQKPETIMKSKTAADVNLRSTIDVIQSDDNSLGALSFRYEYISGSVRYGFKVFDDEGDEAYSSEASFNPKNYEEFVALEILTPEGELVISGWNGFYYTLYTTEGESDFTEAEIRVDEKEVRNFMVDKNHKNEFIISGTYRDEGTKGMSGVFQTKMDLATGIPDGIEVSEFNQNMCAQLANPTYVEKRLKEITKGKEIEQPVNYLMRGSEVMEDGTIIMMTERVISSSNYQQILLTAFDSDHNVIWHSVIKKHQYVAELGYMAASYGSYAKGNDLYIIFGDNSSNYDENMQQDGTPVKARIPGGSHVLVVAKVNIKNGATTLSDPLYKRDVGLYLMPRYSTSDPEDSQFYFIVSDFKKTKYVSLNFGE